MSGLVSALMAAVVLAGLSTGYDFIWAHFHVQHKPVYGLAHGMTLLSAAGLALGWRTGRLGRGAIGGALSGLIAAAGFYALAGILGFAGALIAAWMLLWLLFAALAVWLDTHHAGTGTALVRGIVAAGASGVAFWLVSGMWTSHDPAGPSYLRNFASWTFAFFPGFAALMWNDRSAPQPPS